MADVTAADLVRALADQHERAAEIALASAGQMAARIEDDMPANLIAYRQRRVQELNDAHAFHSRAATGLADLCLLYTNPSPRD